MRSGETYAQPIESTRFFEGMPEVKGVAVGIWCGWRKQLGVDRSGRCLSSGERVAVVTAGAHATRAMNCRMPSITN
jgi:hypothetical protein